MAEIWGAAIVAGVTLYGQHQAGKAADAQAGAADQGIAEERRQYDQTRADNLPFLQAGQNAIGLQNAFLAGDTSGFENSADYQFRLQQGLQSQERGAAARGGFMGGGADADRIALAQGLAGQAADSYWNKLAGQAGQGQTAGADLGTFGANMAGNVGGYLQNAANARASSYGANADTAAALGGAISNWYQGNLANNPGGTGWYLGSKPGKG